MNKITQKAIEEAIDYAYGLAINGLEIPMLPDFESAYELAKEYQEEYPGDIEEQIDSLITWQCAKSGVSGAITGLGGILTTILTLPANIASVIAIQTRMIVAIAILCGYDVKDEKVRVLINSCLVKEKLVDIIKETAKGISLKLLQRMPVDLMKIVSKAIGKKMVAKLGQKGILSTSKSIPIFGALVGGAIDIASTKAIGIFAKKTLMSENTKQIFIKNYNDNDDLEAICCYA